LPVLNTRAPAISSHGPTCPQIKPRSNHRAVPPRRRPGVVRAPRCMPATNRSVAPVKAMSWQSTIASNAPLERC
jgi:hypothetical protein